MSLSLISKSQPSLPAQAKRLVAMRFLIYTGFQTSYFIGVIGTLTYADGASVVATSLAVLFMNVFVILGSFAGGAALDAWGPRRHFLLSIVGTLATGAAIIAFGSATETVLAGAALLGFVMGFAQPIATSYPAYLTDDPVELKDINSTITMFSNLSIIVGPTLGGFVAAAASSRAVFVLMILFTLLALIAGWGFKPRASRVVGQADADSAEEGEHAGQANRSNPSTSARATFAASIKTVFTNSVLALLFCIIFLSNFGYGAFDPLESFFYRDVLHVGVEWMGWLSSACGVGAVLGFVPQMLVLFLMLAFLEACGYMARIAFVLDRIFRKFGLSGKSFIPMLIGTGCGIPGVMASRTIENERDRRMTIMTTTFIPCGAKVPFIAMIAGALFGGSAWVSTSAYFIGMAAIICSGIMLKKTKPFAGEPAPFVMELPAYHWPTLGNVLRSMWERGWSFIKKAGTIILLSTIFVWFTTYFGWVDGTFRMLDESEIDSSILAAIGGAIAWIFKPLGWGNWQAVVASITGLIAKENIVGTLGILYGGNGSVYSNLASAFTPITAYSFLVFNLLCAPCFAAIGAIKREMNNAGWTWFAIGYQCGFAYVIALMINQFGNLFTGNANLLGVVAAAAFLAGMVYMLFKPYKEAAKLSAKP